MRERKKKREQRTELYSLRGLRHYFITLREGEMYITRKLHSLTKVSPPNSLLPNSILKNASQPHPSHLSLSYLYTRFRLKIFALLHTPIVMNNSDAVRGKQVSVYRMSFLTNSNSFQLSLSRVTDVTHILCFSIM